MINLKNLCILTIEITSNGISTYLIVKHHDAFLTQPWTSTTSTLHSPRLFLPQFFLLFSFSFSFPFLSQRASVGSIHCWDNSTTVKGL